MEQVRCRGCNSLTFPVVCSVCGAQVGVPARTPSSVPSLVGLAGLTAFMLAEAAPEPAWLKMGGVILIVVGLVWKYWPHGDPGRNHSLVNFVVAKVRRARRGPVPKAPPPPADRGPTTEVHLHDWGYSRTCYEDELQSRGPTTPARPWSG